jgi:glycosyltransferase involved in cell wall biosynthesis
LLARLPRRIAESDIVHLAEVYWSAVLPTLALCRLMKKPLVWSPHGSLLAAHVWPDVRRKRLKHIWDKIARGLVSKTRSVFHVTSDEEAEASFARIPGVSVKVIPNGVDLPDAVPPRSWRPDGAIRLLFMGRITPKKGIENLLTAIPLCASNVSLTICGTGDDEYTERVRLFCANSGITDRVTFAGHVEGAQKEKAFENADLCIVPSYTENFCIVVAEALGRGVPVVASRRTPWAGIEKHECGLWVENDPESLARAIGALAPRDLAAMGARGREWMLSDFGWRKIALDMRHLCGEVVAMSRGQ